MKVIKASCLSNFRRIKLPELQALLYQQDGETVFGVEYDVALHPGNSGLGPLGLYVTSLDLKARSRSF